MISLMWQHTLDGAETDAIVDLLAAAERVDGTGGVSEDVRLTLRPGLHLGSAAHLIAREGETVVGYAALGGEGTDRQAELVVHPGHRRTGVGTALVRALSEAAGAPAVSLNIWAHGDTPAAAALAARTGFGRVRVLLQLRRPLGAPGAGPDELAEPVLPEGVTVRTFEVGKDEDAWLAVNAAAFADHPEQGRWTLDDLCRREEEPWFDPAGFFLAERAGALVGFHWTKVHPVDPVPAPPATEPPAGEPPAAGGPAAGGTTGPGGGPAGRVPAEPGPIGEVYVVGVDPRSGGSGLGRALTMIGLRHLRDRGLAAVMLYVDEDNERAVRLYTGLGFRRHTADVSYLRADQG